MSPRLLLYLVASGAISLTPTLAGATAAKWSNRSARTMDAGRLELGLFSASRWAPHKGVEIGLHPVFFFFSPKIEAKFQWDDGSKNRGGWMFATQHSVQYATRPLSLLSKKGSLALLPDDVDIPISFQLESDLLVSRTVGSSLFTYQVGGAVALKEKSDLPLLDFPFLYQRFAPQSGPLLVRTGLDWDGRVFGPVIYRADLVYSLFPLNGEQPIPMGWALEGGGQLGLSCNDRHRIVLFARFSVAEYPVGTRIHWFPGIDYRFKLFD